MKRLISVFALVAALYGSHVAFSLFERRLQASYSPVNAGSRLVSYTTATATSSIAISGLDLDTDLAYEFTVETGTTSALASLSATVNGTNTSTHGIAVYELISSGVTNNFVVNGSHTAWDVTGTVTFRGFAGTLKVSKAYDGSPNATSHFIARTSASGDPVGLFVGAMSKAATTNVTALSWALSTGTCDWRVWVTRPQRALGQP